MKQRLGFVSNSSSSSFVIKLHDITYEQRLLIYAVENDPSFQQNPWTINCDYNTGEITGHTFLDNFSMKDYFEKIGLHPRQIYTWGD